MLYREGVDNSNYEENESDSLKAGFNFITKQFSGAIHEKMIKVLLNTGVCDVLNDGKQRTIKELCEQCNVDSREGMFRLLRYFSFHNFIKHNKETDTYSKNENTQYFTKNNKLNGIINLYSSDVYSDLYKLIPNRILDEKSKCNNSEIWDHLNNNDSNKLLFKNAMASLTEIACDEIIRNFDFSNSNTVVDVGGSHGLLIEKIVDKYPHIQGINFDLDKVISTNPKSNNPRLQHVSGSFFESVPPADTYILKLILHDWSDENSIKILNTISRSMKPGGKVYIFDYIFNENNFDNTILLYDIKMDSLFGGGKERSQREWNDLLNQTDFKIDKIYSNKSFRISKK